MHMIICRNKIIIAIIFFLTAKAAGAFPVLDVTDYEASFNFTDKKTVLIKKGDSQDYKSAEFDDSGWHVISLPSAWEDLFPGWTGICWYRLHVRFPAEAPKNSAGISLGVITDADEVFINGRLIGKSGKFPPARESAYDKQRIYEISAHLIKPGKDNVLAVRVAGLFPGESGAIKGKFIIAPFQKLQRKYLLREFIDVLFVAVYLSIAVYFSLVFLIRSISKEYLFFTLFTLSASFYIFLRSQIKYFLTGDFLSLKRIEYIVLILMLPLMMEYITFFFKRKHSIFHYFYFLVSAASLALVMFYNEPKYWNNVLIYFIEPTWIIPILICLYISFKELKNEIDAKYLFVSFIIVWILFINDVFVERLIYNFFNVAKYGFLIIIIGTAIIMRRRVLRLSGEAESYRISRLRKPTVTDETRQKFEKALAYLNDNYTFDISRENFAESIGLNHDYLGRLFIQLKGVKMSDYINELRVKKAAEMLSGSSKNVTDIAFAVGFESLSTFYRVFQKVMNESPNEYRERNRSK